MTEEPLSLALARLERALARLEAGRVADPALEARHRALQAAAAAAIARLDRLIAAAADR